MRNRVESGILIFDLSIKEVVQVGRECDKRPPGLVVWYLT